LVVEVVVCAVEPKPRADRPVNSERSADGIAEVAILQFVMFGEYLDSLGRACSFYRDTELRSPGRRSTAGIVGQGAVALRRSTGARRGGFAPVPPRPSVAEFPLQLAQVFERFLVVASMAIHLHLWVDGFHCVDAERYSPSRCRRTVAAVKLCSHSAGFGPEVVIAAALRCGPHGLGGRRRDG